MYTIRSKLFGHLLVCYFKNKWYFNVIPEKASRDETVRFDYVHIREGPFWARMGKDLLLTVFAKLEAYNFIYNCEFNYSQTETKTYIWCLNTFAHIVFFRAHVQIIVVSRSIS